MSTFLDQVQVINVANAAGGTVYTAAPPEAPAAPEPPGNSDAALTELRANIAKIKAETKAITSAVKARLSTEKIAAEIDPDGTKDNDDAAETTIHTGKNTVVVHHKKSGADDPGVIVPCVAIFFVFSWLIIRAVMAPVGQRIASRRGRGIPILTGQGLTEDEQAILLKLQRTIGQMERRIESLETILIDETRTKENYGTKH